MDRMSTHQASQGSRHGASVRGWVFVARSRESAVPNIAVELFEHRGEIP